MKKMEILKLNKQLNKQKNFKIGDKVYWLEFRNNTPEVKTGTIFLDAPTQLDLDKLDIDKYNLKDLVIETKEGDMIVKLNTTIHKDEHDANETKRWLKRFGENLKKKKVWPYND